MDPIRIVLINIHGLIKSSGLEIGRDADNGGQTRYVYELAEYLSRHPEVKQVHLFTRLIDDPKLDPSYSLPVEIINDKLDIRRIPFAGKKYRMKEELWDHLDEFVGNSIKYLKENDIIPNWIHSHYGDAGYAACELSTLLKLPFAHTGHSLGIAKKNKVRALGLTDEEGERKFKFSKRLRAENRTIEASSFIITSTTQEIETYKLYDSFKQGNFKTLAPGVDTEKFTPYYQTNLPGEDVEAEIQRKYWVGEYIEKFLSQPHKPCILALSRPDRRKNLHTLIDVFGKDKELQSLANLVIFAGIRKDIEKMAENEREVLVQILLQMDKYDLYGRLAIPKKHDVENEVATIYRYCAEKRGVFANLTLHENFGLTLIESASCGLPVVSTKNGGPSEIIPKCKNGILVDPLNFTEIKNAIIKIMTDEQLWRDYSDSGILNTQKYYSWERHVNQYMQWVEIALQTFDKIRDGMPTDVRMKNAKKLLVSDIDGTMISDELDDPGLKDLREVLDNRGNEFALAYASGRSVRLVREVILSHRLPRPDFLICAVGSQIYYRRGDEYFIDKGWSRYLDRNWKRDEIKKRLDHLQFLELQEAEGQNPHKISYYLKDKIWKPDQVDTILGKFRNQVSVIMSHDRFLDILPRRASKGKALRYICKKWSIPYSKLYTAGDSGNDHDMLEGSGNAIIVGNSAPELDHLKPAKNLYRAESFAAAGVLEGLKHFGAVD
ncbi:MAG: HAD-IIB family hydrolase [Saprospiraceae bacterium]|nr:HAD-IIB family hydrolase [Saprospiraceae bacterium]